MNGADEPRSVPGWDVAAAILRGLEALRLKYPEITQEDLEHAAAEAAVRVKLSYRVFEK